MAYLLTCPKCAAAVPVELGMSGETVRCVCGATVEVPMLRTLRNMPRTDQQNDGVKRGEWSWRHAVTVVGGTLLAIGLIFGVVRMRQRQDLDPNRYWNEVFPTASPARSWEVWRSIFRDGIDGPMPGRNEKVMNEYAQYRGLFDALHNRAGRKSNGSISPGRWPRSAGSRSLRRCSSRRARRSRYRDSKGSK
ncbi:MAG: hypothetical protein QM811_30180 [Pirellulales bacterium]